MCVFIKNRSAPATTLCNPPLYPPPCLHLFHVAGKTGFKLQTKSELKVQRDSSRDIVIAELR